MSEGLYADSPRIGSHTYAAAQEKAKLLEMSRRASLAASPLLVPQHMRACSQANTRNKKEVSK